MFRLLSKESNIFSIPVYIVILLLIVIGFNFLDFSSLDVISAVITFAGVALGYFCFNAIALNYQTHLPLFLYTAFIFALYPGDLDIGIAVSLFTNSIILLLLTDNDLVVRKNAIILVGAILALNFIFLPTGSVKLICFTAASFNTILLWSSPNSLEKNLPSNICMPIVSTKL